MTDFHTHILPKMDDGAKTVDVASQMLLSAKNQGVTTVLATSHYYGKVHSPEEYIESRNNSFELLKPYIPEGITVKLGAEVYLSERMSVDYERLSKLCIEGTKYLLIELPFVKNWDNNLYRKLSDLMAETGCVPVLAHVDRYAAFAKNPGRLLDFIKMGCLIQVNTAAFLERRARGLAFALLKKGYVHCLGTDMHDLAGRKGTMDEAKKVVQEAGFAEKWEIAQENMRKILADERLQIEIPLPIVRHFGKFR